MIEDVGRTHRIIHLSDPHISKVALTWEYTNLKSFAGLMAVLLVRMWLFPCHRLESLFRFLHQTDYDHLLVSGDLVSSGIKKEYLTAGRLLARHLPDPGRVTILPGNHDAYSKKSVEEGMFDRVFSSYGPGIDRYGQYPFVKKIGEEVVIIGLNGVRVNPVGDATGEIPEGQLERLSQILEQPETRERFKIVVNHFGLYRWDGSPDKSLHGLSNFEDLARMLDMKGYDLYLHGHIHRNYLLAPHSDQRRLICCSGSCTQRSRHPSRKASFNMYEIKGKRLYRVLRYVFKGADVWEPEVLIDSPHPGTIPCTIRQ